MLVENPLKMSISNFVGFVKGKSSLMIFERFTNLKYKYENRYFECCDFYVNTVGRNKEAIQQYIKNQLNKDMISDQIIMKEYMDPFKDSK